MKSHLHSSLNFLLSFMQYILQKHIKYRIKFKTKRNNYIIIYVMRTFSPEIANLNF